MKLLFTILVIAISFASNAQSTRFQPSDFYVSGGVLIQNPFFISQEEFTKYNSESLLLSGDFSEYFENDPGSFDQLRPIFRLNAGFTREDDPSIVLRTGLTFWNKLVGHGLYQRNTPGAYDTLVSLQTGQEIYLDTTFKEVYLAELSGDFMNVEFGVSFTTDIEDRFVIYGGANLGLGFGFNMEHRIWKQEYDQLDQQIPGYFYSGVTNAPNSNQETFRRGAVFSSQISFPVGISWKLGNKEAPLTKLAINLELNPMINITAVPKLRTFSRFLATSTIGIRYYFD